MRKFLQAISLAMTICLLFSASFVLSACNNEEYYKLNIEMEEIDHIYAVDYTGNMVTESGIYYLSTKEKNKYFTEIQIRCEIGFEPDFTIKTNKENFKLEIDRQKIAFVNSEIGPVIYYYTIDNSIFSGDETVKLSGSTVTAKYPVSLEINDTNAEILGQYEDFSATIDGQDYRFNDFKLSDDNPNYIYVTYGMAFEITTKLTGKTYKDEPILIADWSDNYEIVPYEDGTIYKIDKNTMSYNVIMYSKGSIVLYLSNLNAYYGK